VLSKWLIKYPDIIQTGSATVDGVLTVLLSTTILVGGALGCFLDNIIPGNAKERGLEDWAKEMELIDPTIDKKTNEMSNVEYVWNTFDFPFGMNLLTRWKWTSYVPFLPTYKRL
ncbi:Solute carrier family 23 member 1, partial [Camponotus floridanus]